MLLNDAAKGKSWSEHQVKKQQIYKRNERIEETSETIWGEMQRIVEENIQLGNIHEK